MEGLCPVISPKQYSFIPPGKNPLLTWRVRVTWSGKQEPECFISRQHKMENVLQLCSLVSMHRVIATVTVLLVRHRSPTVTLPSIAAVYADINRSRSSLRP